MPHYTVSQLPFRICGPQAADAERYLPGLAPFRKPDGVEQFTILLDDSVPPTPPLSSPLYRFYFPEKDMLCLFDTTEDYRLQMTPAHSDTRKGACPFLLRQSPDDATTHIQCTDPSLLPFGLWFAFALQSAVRHRIPIHASSVVWHDQAVALLGESGTGKSTHASLWLQHIAGSHLLNDDSPVLDTSGAHPLLWGSPWSGKTPCYVNRGFPLRAVVRLVQAPENRIRRLNSLESLAALMPSCPPALMADEGCRTLLFSTVEPVLRHVPVFQLCCRPDVDAARLCFNTLFPSST